MVTHLVKLYKGGIISMKGIIQKTTISDISVFLDDNSGYLILQVSFVPSTPPRTVHNFVLNNPVDVQRVIKLLQYTHSRDVEELWNKEIKTAYKNHFTYGFGDLAEDKFVPFLTKELMEVSKEEILEM